MQILESQKKIKHFRIKKRIVKKCNNKYQKLFITSNPKTLLFQPCDSSFVIRILG